MKFEVPHLPAGGELSTPAAPVPGERVVSPTRPPSTRQFKAFICFAFILAICFGRTFYTLVAFARHSDLYSYVLGIPFVSVYLIKLKWRELDFTSPPERQYALVPLMMGAALLMGYWFAAGRGWSPALEDSLGLMMLSFLLFLLADAMIFIGGKALRALTFPIAFTFFSVPFPEVMRRGIETFSQYASADVAATMLRLSGMPVLQTGISLHLPGFSPDVARECSGIHSSVILLIVGVLAAHLILKSNWWRWVFVLAMIPLGLLRNGFRIFILSQLGVRIGPQILDSWFHHHCGPIFFALSMIPFLFLLIYFRKKDLQGAPKQPLSNE